jgi:hypothetical protein
MNMLLHACELELLSALNSYNVRYLVIGGHAVLFYGHIRSPRDLDILIDREGDNPSKVMSALRSIRFSPNFSTHDLTKPKTKIPLPYLDSELLNSAEGPPFGEVYTRRVVTEEKGILICVVSLQDLLAQKRALGREKDLLDVEALEALNNSIQQPSR